ncbi:MAG: riboflavin synthase [Thermodesulfobacteriota bacterium]
MFTGIIEGPGTIRRIEPNGEGRILAVETRVDLSETKTGDSIAVNGACLTAVKIQKHLFEVDVAPETVQRTTFRTAAPGDRVNVERALKISDRIDGHLVSGHIDGTGTIASKTRASNAWIISVQADPALLDEMIEKGSVAIDGISLTVNSCTDNSFEVSIIPHTAGLTTIESRVPGDSVNIETDMIGKYVKKFLGGSRTGNSGAGRAGSDISMDLLGKTGFL